MEELKGLEVYVHFSDGRGREDQANIIYTVYTYSYIVYCIIYYVTVYMYMYMFIYVYILICTYLYMSIYIYVYVCVLLYGSSTVISSN